MPPMIKRENKYTISHTPRGENTKADEIVKHTKMKVCSHYKSIVFHTLQELSVLKSNYVF